MTPRDRVCGASGRRKGAGDAGPRQNFSTPSDGPHTRPERRLTKAFGRRRARFAMPRIATAHAPRRKPWYAVSMGHDQRSLVLERRWRGGRETRPRPAVSRTWISPGRPYPLGSGRRSRAYPSGRPANSQFGSQKGNALANWSAGARQGSQGTMTPAPWYCN